MVISYLPPLPCPVPHIQQLADKETNEGGKGRGESRNGKIIVKSHGPESPGN
jgi:hypothetical protein